MSIVPREISPRVSLTFSPRISPIRDACLRGKFSKIKKKLLLVLFSRTPRNSIQCEFLPEIFESFLPKFVQDLFLVFLYKSISLLKFLENRSFHKFSAGVHPGISSKGF